MVDYEMVKTWLSQKENKQKIVYGVCFVLVFVVGFGTGEFDKNYRQARQQPQSNYTTKAAAGQIQPKSTPGQGTAVPVVASASTTANCLIKGNISSGGKKIYHVPGGAFYKIVKPEQCFNAEGEALAAGFVKSSR
ncbi:MAG: hypothetical protein KGJ93_01610 [Patescibacteria group bacterium]|nr:hypothetical protein [Patescibacteria group bacterium]